MKLLQLDIEGFRSFFNVTWKPGDLNVVIGPNASGKSNLLKVLEMLSIAAQGGLGKYIQREGGMEPLLWDGRAERIGFRLKTSPVMENRDLERESLTYGLDLVRLGVTSSTYRIEYEILGNYHRVEKGEKDQPFKLLERSLYNAVIFDETEKELMAPPDSISEQETLLSMAAGPFTINRLIAAYQTNLSNWRIYQDFQTHRETPIRQPALVQTETSVAADGQNLIAVLHTLYTGSREFKQDLNKAMAAAFGDDFEELVFPPAADQRIQLRIRWKSLQREQPAADLSDGTLRFLFLIVVLANPKPPPLIAIDEPETGLHPSMLPIVAEYAAEASRRSQVIFTTHSAEFLDAFGDTVPTTTVVYREDGKTCLRVVADEELRYWLEEYTLGKLYRSGELESMG